MKIAINSGCGSFKLSDEAFKMLNKITKNKFEIEYIDPEDRSNEHLIEVIEYLGKKAAGKYCKIKIVEIPDDVKWIICSGDDGIEWIAEKHRTWC